MEVLTSLYSTVTSFNALAKELLGSWVNSFISLFVRSSVKKLQFENSPLEENLKNGSYIITQINPKPICIRVSLFSLDFSDLTGTNAILRRKNNAHKISEFFLHRFNLPWSSYILLCKIQRKITKKVLSFKFFSGMVFIIL